MMELEILAIDTGPEYSGWVRLGLSTRRGNIHIIGGREPNQTVLTRVYEARRDPVVRYFTCEMMKARGQGLQQDVLFEAIYWVGRFCEAWSCAEGDKSKFARQSRNDIAYYLTGKRNANDAEIRAAIVSMLGTAGDTVVKFGNKYKIHRDAWDALAAAIVFRAKLAKVQT